MLSYFRIIIAFVAIYTTFALPLNTITAGICGIIVRIKKSDEWVARHLWLSILLLVFGLIALLITSVIIRLYGTYIVDIIRGLF